NDEHACYQWTFKRSNSNPTLDLVHPPQMNPQVVLSGLRVDLSHVRIGETPGATVHD
ncbi:hypothetical protein Tco_1318964, partial [Tanacetum coccineum]